MTILRIGPLGLICELLFLSERDRRHRRQFRRAIRADRYKPVTGMRYTRSELTDPSVFLVRSMGVLTFRNNDRTHVDSPVAEAFRDGLCQDMIAAMRPRFWELRRRVRRWLRNRRRFLGPRVRAI